MCLLKILKYLEGNYIQRLVRGGSRKPGSYATGTATLESVDPLMKNNDEYLPYEKLYVYDTSKQTKMAPNSGTLRNVPMTIINLDGNWVAGLPKLMGDIRTIKYTNGNKYFTLGKNLKSGKEVLLDYYDGNVLFDDFQLDLSQIRRNIYPRLNVRYKQGGNLNNGMTYNYNEFLNQFAGVEKYKNGNKVESCKCGCKKVKKAEDGVKTEKQSSKQNLKQDQKQNPKSDLYNSPTFLIMQDISAGTPGYVDPRLFDPNLPALSPFEQYLVDNAKHVYDISVKKARDIENWFKTGAKKVKDTLGFEEGGILKEQLGTSETSNSKLVQRFPGAVITRKR